jgi:hypothetical protein
VVIVGIAAETFWSNFLTEKPGVGCVVIRNGVGDA